MPWYVWFFIVAEVLAVGISIGFVGRRTKSRTLGWSDVSAKAIHAAFLIWVLVALAS